MNTAVLQIVMAGIGAMGFSVLFNIRGYKVVLCSIGGALAGSVYLISVENGMEIFTALFVAAIAAAASSELLARVVKAPVLLFLVPILIPLIPGSDLYYMMSFFVLEKYRDFGWYVQRVLVEAGAIALGIICVESFVNVLLSLCAMWMKKER